MKQCKCLIWGTDAEVQNEGPFNTLVNSDRAGGRYKVGPASEWTKSLSNQQKAVLSTWVLEQNKMLVGWPEINDQNFPKILNSKLLTTKERADKLMLALGEMSPFLGENVNYKNDRIYAIAECHHKDGWHETKALLDYCKAKFGFDNLTDEVVILGVGGQIAVDALIAPNKDSKQIFVAMWFNGALDAAYSAIAGGISDVRKVGGEAAEFKPQLINRKAHNNKIDDEIIAEIRKSRAVIVDLTCGLAAPNGGWSESAVVGAPRGGVYFEAGFALGLGLPVIWTCRDDVADLDGVVHFDVRQYNQIRWNAADLSKLRKDIKNRIEATIV